MNTRKLKRQTRTRRNITSSSDRPRLSVTRSNKYVSAQLIDDILGVTLVGITQKSLKTKGTKMDNAKALGLELASKLKAKKITKIVFDRGSYAYHGRVKNVAEGLREGGIDF